jgi:phosphate transport system protein
MAALAEDAIFKATEAFKNLDMELANRIIRYDSVIDTMEIEIESMVIDILALQQPIAKDLRFVTTGMKVNSELERIADLATNIAKCVLFMEQQISLKPIGDMQKLFSLALVMVRDAVTSFVNRDYELAKKVILSDVEADTLRTAIQNVLVNHYMLEDKTVIPRAVSFFLVTRHYERICDHATNIAEDVIYMIDAKVVKHHPEILENKPDDISDRS